MKGLYICNPEKNKTCLKTHCRYSGTGECYCTTNKEYEADNPPEELLKEQNYFFEHGCI